MKEADQLAMVIMEVSRRVRDIVPQLTLRMYQGMDPKLYQKALDCLGEGVTYPMLYQDENIIPGIQKVFGISYEEALGWMPLGCGEFTIDHRIIASPNSILNLPNVLWGTINGGYDATGQYRLTPNNTTLADYESFEELWQAYCRNIGGFDMGVKGAALATIISQALSCIWVLSFLLGKKTYLKIRRKNCVLKRKVILPCLALGLSVFIMQSSESVISVCFNSSLLKYGGDIAVGAMTILTSVMQFAMLPSQGLGQGAQPIISYNYGARNADRVREAYRLLLKVSLCYSVIFWAVVILFPEMFAGMFTSDPALLDFTSHALRIYMAVICIFGIQMACQLTFGALGNAKASILVAVTRKFILLLPLIYLMPAIFPADKTTAVYLAEPVADTLAITFTAILFFFQFRKAMREIEGPRRA